MSLLRILEDKPEDVLLPNEDVRGDALKNLKLALDSVAPTYSPLDAVYVDGLKADQVWVQAQMILDGVAGKLSSTIAKYTPATDADEEISEEEISESDQDLSEKSGSSEDDELKDDEELGELEENEDKSKDESVDDENELDLSNFKDDYGESAEEEPTTQPDRSDAEGSDREEQFDLAEFQQHVLRLEQEGSEDDGPEIDFNAGVDASSDDDDDLHYSDFFGSAPKKISNSKEPKTKNSKKRVQFKDDDDLWSDDGKGADDDDDAEEGLDDEDHDLQNQDEEEDVMSLTRKDLFDDEDEDADQTETEQLSKFEKQQMEIARQIEELEAENMGQKEWGMRGEAKAKDRPEDSLFNLEFDRNSKPAPVITEESTSTLEELIKSRIKKQQFDDIPRRSELATPGDLKRELPELSEQKSGKSLAELYEDDKMRSENPEYFAKQDSAAMDAAHQEITSLYQSVANKLDALCSWAFTPRKSVPSISVVTQTPSISMEEAQPGTLAPEAQLAPQEVFKSESATPMHDSEMSTSMKRKRRREKSLKKGGSKPQGSAASQPSGKRTKRENKEDMFSTLKRGNVTMVDRRGEKRDMHGNKVETNVPQTASHMKL